MGDFCLCGYICRVEFHHEWGSGSGSDIKTCTFICIFLNFHIFASHFYVFSNKQKSMFGKEKYKVIFFMTIKIAYINVKGEGNIVHIQYFDNYNLGKTHKK